MKWQLSIVRVSALLFGALLFSNTLLLSNTPLFAQAGQPVGESQVPADPAAEPQTTDVPAETQPDTPAAPADIPVAETSLPATPAEPAQPAAQEPGGIAETLPPAETVVAAFSTDGERVAALQILMELFEFRERSSAAQAKRTEYMRAIDRISPSTTLNADLSRETRRLRQSAEFRFDVIRQFAPALAGEAQGAMMQQQFEASNENSLFMFWASVAGTCLFALAIPVIYAMRNQREQPTRVNTDPAFQLPQELADAKTLGRTYGLSFDCGTFSRRADGSPFFRTPDGREKDALGFDAEPGDIVSAIHSGSDAVLYYNNTRNTDWLFVGTIENMSLIPMGPLEVASFCSVVAGFTVLNYTTLVAAREVNNMLPAALGAWGVLMLFVTYFFTRTFGVRLCSLRLRRFERKWKPRLLAFMKERVDQIMGAHAPAGTRDRRLAMDGAINPGS